MATMGTAKLAWDDELDLGAGLPSRARKATRTKATRTKARPEATRARRLITMGIGVGIPCQALALSSIGGQLCQAGSYGLGACSLGLCSGVLAVSLSHLAWAVRDITGSARWQAWCIAAAVDCSLILGELAGLAGYRGWQVSAVMACVTVCSAVLNCWAFLAAKCR